MTLEQFQEAQKTEAAYWRKQLRSEQHRFYNRPMDKETELNIQSYWKSILETRETWNDRPETDAA